MAMIRYVRRRFVVESLRSARISIARLFSVGAGADLVFDPSVCFEMPKVEDAWRTWSVRDVRLQACEAEASDGLKHRDDCMIVPSTDLCSQCKLNARLWFVLTSWICCKSYHHRKTVVGWDIR